ncbi:hypothetical protein HJG60_011721 [Phyllostomus discolor]|uniref:Uncharacterized protein n=1 Tax=Phyllostomus discolor TaxID=89673 RepID=A0A833ZYL7_9CHIR|nr:hypothetical protein HJG60_011721 [Phyllostomus discolor]
MKCCRLPLNRSTSSPAPSSPQGPGLPQPSRIYHDRTTARKKPAPTPRPTALSADTLTSTVGSTPLYTSGTRTRHGRSSSTRHFRVCPTRCSKQTVPPLPPLDYATGPERSGWRSQSALLLEGDLLHLASLRPSSEPPVVWTKLWEVPGGGGRTGNVETPEIRKWCSWE